MQKKFLSISQKKNFQKMKKHIYLLPGTAANSKIFDRIELPKERFELHFLEWILPTDKNESLEAYAGRMCKKIQHAKPILLGVSFGGILVQEMSKQIECEKIVHKNFKNANHSTKILRPFTVYGPFGRRKNRNFSK